MNVKTPSVVPMGKLMQVDAADDHAQRRAGPKAHFAGGDEIEDAGGHAKNEPDRAHHDEHPAE